MAHMEAFGLDYSAYLEFVDSTERAKTLSTDLLRATEGLQRYSSPEFSDSIRRICNSANGLYQFSNQMSKAVDNISVELQITLNSINNILEESTYDIQSKLHNVEAFITPE